MLVFGVNSSVNGPVVWGRTDAAGTYDNAAGREVCALITDRVRPFGILDGR